MTKIPIQIRQGDVLLEAVDAIPSDAKLITPDFERGHVLAEGEITGHSHRIPARYAGNAAKYRTEGDAQFMRVTAPVPLRHEEHKTVCHLCPDQQVGEPLPLATHRLSESFARDAYLCEKHATIEGGDLVALAEPGATEVPPSQWKRTIHLEYVPRDLPRRVVD